MKYHQSNQSHKFSRDITNLEIIENKNPNTQTQLQYETTLDLQR